MTPIRFGLCLPAEWRDVARRATYVADVQRALEAAAGRFESAWMVDHLQFAGADVLEAFTSLSYFAGLHPQFTFGHAVVCQSFRNPALVAKMGATLQLLTGGRFVVGLGAGWHTEEYRAYGYAFPPASVRVAQLEEAVQIIRALWTQPRASFAGQHYHVEEAVCEPRPDPVPPLMIGAFGPKMLRLAARYADVWNVSSTGPEHYGRLVQEFERACAEVGRDPGSLRRSWIGGCACAPSLAQAQALAGDLYSSASEEDFGFVGTPAQIVEQMRRFIDLGVTEFMLDLAGFPRLDGLELAVQELLPALQP